MKDQSSSFEKSIPEVYEKYLGPYLYEPFSKYVTNRILGDPQQVLEIGCGSGRLTNHLVNSLSQTAKLTALDINSNMIAVAKEKVQSYQVEFVHGDAQEMPFEDNTFDFVVCQFGFMFLPNKQKGFNEAWRVLKPRGQFIFVTWDKAENNITLHISQETILSHLKASPPAYFGRAYYSMNNPDDLLAYTKNAGFENGKIEKVSLQATCQTALDAAIGFVEGNSIIKEILKEGGPELLQKIESNIVKRINSEVCQDPVCSEINAWLGEAFK
ncbi:methyltransferase domain-containing protein [Algoriphagus lutimaris]|uniref:class I SAM-dependent methyltransferase n=1 Tax=Algoriphagus lutimaris TaxID=613197 RepID=UPI00196AC647|nr:methyltransferase domain-containing protein [Algoriphagus lutimaris]MBN3521085.1 methyltransferase domain-containing protein [Algoriphagus lutimaris]